MFDRAGDIGPTLWWKGETIGSWATGRHGDVRTVVPADRGRDADHAIAQAASTLQRRLLGTVVVPSVRTPLEQALSAGRAP